MNITNKYIIPLFALLLFAITGCFPDNSRIYDGPLQVEFSPVEDSMDLSIQSTYEANVQLIGPHQDSDITVNFEIDSENSTAVQGQHFEISGTTTVIPANSSFGTITVTGIPDNIDEESVVFITLLGNGNGEVIAAENYKSLELTLEP